MMYDTLADLVEAYQPSKDFENFKLDFLRTFAFEPDMIADEFVSGDFETICNHLFDQSTKFYNQRVREFLPRQCPSSNKSMTIRRTVLIKF